MRKNPLLIFHYAASRIDFRPAQRPLMNTASNSGNDTRKGRVSPNDLTSHHPSYQSGFWWLLVVGFIAAMLCVPFIRSVYWLGDEGMLLNGATRLLKGSRLYVDFF